MNQYPVWCSQPLKCSYMRSLFQGQLRGTIGNISRDTIHIALFRIVGENDIWLYSKVLNEDCAAQENRLTHVETDSCSLSI